MIESELNVKNKCLFCGEILIERIIKCLLCGNDRCEVRILVLSKLLEEKKDLNLNKNEVDKYFNLYEKIEKFFKFFMKFGEKVILKDNGFIYNYNEDDEYYYVLILIN